ncbi:MAG: hypothetical protein ACI9E4_001112, partial [Pseudohongiellaceae bacterium]
DNDNDNDNDNNDKHFFSVANFSPRRARSSIVRLLAAFD